MSDYIPNPESYLDNFDLAYLMAAGEDPFDFGFMDNQPAIGVSQPLSKVTRVLL